MRRACAEPGHDDGLDTRRSRRGDREKKEDRKLRQLCGQVGRTVELSLAESRDDVLIDLYVVAVTPTPVPGRLRVWVRGHGPVDPRDALERLSAARGWLRGEVAEAISRRRVPDLVFEWVADGVTP